MEPTAPAPPVGTTSRPFLAPPEDAVPSSRCVRCGAVTPAGVALCPDHNPGGVPGPSSTQMHATILAGVLLGFLGFLVLARFAMSTGGPFEVSLTGAALDRAGALHVGLQVANQGDTESIADCRVTRDGVPRPDDAIFRTERLAPGVQVTVEHVLPALPPDVRQYDTATLTITCR